jgi:hypothetical protein
MFDRPTITGGRFLTFSFSLGSIFFKYYRALSTVTCGIVFEDISVLVGKASKSSKVQTLWY